MQRPGLLDHATDAANLPFDPVQPRDEGLLLAGVEHPQYRPAGPPGLPSAGLGPVAGRIARGPRDAGTGTHLARRSTSC